MNNNILIEIYNSFDKYIPQHANSKRALQSIAFYLGLEINLSNLNYEELKKEIGIFIFNNHSLPTGDGAQRTYTLNPNIREIIDLISLRDHVEESCFDFLYKYSKKSVVHKIENMGIAKDKDIHLAFVQNQSIGITLGYLCDVSELPSIKIAIFFEKLKIKINEMELQWEKGIEWFHNDLEKIRAAHYYSGQPIFKGSKNPAINTPAQQSKFEFMPLIADIYDIEIFFNDHTYPAYHKRAVFKKIRDLYNTRTSRANSKKRQSNFALSPETKLLIEQLAKTNGITKPNVLEAIFKKENKEDLQHLINRNAYDFHKNRF